MSQGHGGSALPHPLTLPASAGEIDCSGGWIRGSARSVAANSSIAQQMLPAIRQGVNPRSASASSSDIPRALFFIGVSLLIVSRPRLRMG